jgi:predicted ATPase/DNA-binding SARP family transcriptional activator
MVEMSDAGSLRIETLGGVTIQRDGELVAGLVSRKAEALLVYLVCNRRPLPRETLAALLWEELSQTSALANLSVVLNSLRKQLAPFITVTRHTVGFNPESDFWLDVSELESQLDAWRRRRPRPTIYSRDDVAQLEAGLAHYRGDFLAGFHIRGSRSFEEWALLERERLHRLAVEGLDDLVEYYLNSGRCKQGLEQAERLLNMDPLREKSHQQVMLLLARCGERTAALAQFQACRDILAQELDVEPARETVALYERIQAIERDPHLDLPPQATPCFGRHGEIARITQRLAAPDCRLLTIFGMGGVGKTRLAIQVANELRGAFLNGVCFVPLARVSSPEFLVHAIAEALQFPFVGRETPKKQLLDYLREKELLILLDSFEHLLAGTHLLAEIIRAAPQVILLVTSRERLALREEWLYEIQGLRYPETLPSVQETEDIDSLAAAFGSVRLFLHNATRVQAGFAPSPEERRDILRICQLVEGMPLGIELASAWTRTLPCQEIAREIESNLDFLATAWSNVPARHQSVRAVFDHSWKSLTGEERRLFRRLSVLEGGFHLPAAAQVADASLTSLSSLADKSLLQVTSARPGPRESRYGVHELLRQYGAEHLERDPEEKAEVQSTHCLYFAKFLQQREEEMRAGEQKEALEAIGEEIDNVRAAWRYAVRKGNNDAIRTSLGGLFRFYLVRGWYQEGESAFGAAAEAVEAKAGKDTEWSILFGQLLARQGAFNTELSRFDRADELLRRSITLLSEGDAWDEKAFALSCLGSLCRNRGEYERARALMQESLTLYLENGDRLGAASALNELGTVAYRLARYSEAKEYTGASLDIRRELNDQQGIARCLKDLGTITYRLGDYEEAWRLGNESLELCEAIGDRWGVAACSNNLGNVAERQGDLPTAERLYQQSVAIKRGLGHRMSMATSLYNLGKIARRQEDYERSVELYEEALTILREIGDQWSLSNAVCGLAEVQVEMGRYDDARRNFRQSLAIAREIGSEVLVEAALVERSALLALEGERERAIEVLAMIVERPSREQEIQDRAEQLIAEIGPQLPDQDYQAAYGRGKTCTLEEVLAHPDWQG